MKLRDYVAQGESIVGLKVVGGYTGQIEVSSDVNAEQRAMIKSSPEDDHWLVRLGHATVSGRDGENDINYRIPLNSEVMR